MLRPSAATSVRFRLCTSLVFVNQSPFERFHAFLHVLLFCPFMRTFCTNSMGHFSTTVYAEDNCCQRYHCVNRHLWIILTVTAKLPKQYRAAYSTTTAVCYIRPSLVLRPSQATLVRFHITSFCQRWSDPSGAPKRQIIRCLHSI